MIQYMNCSTLYHNRTSNQPWKLSDAQWRRLRPLLLAGKPLPQTTGRGRPRSADDRAAAEACLYRFFRSQALKYHTFGWNQLPRNLGISPATANRRFRQWNHQGRWPKFWAAFLTIRRTHIEPSPFQSHVGPILRELERAYAFFNSYFFANTLPEQVIVLIEELKRCRGMFRPTRPPQIALSLRRCGEGEGAAMATLLHEMVHLRNNCIGQKDVWGYYHNRLFRDTAVLAGLECLPRQNGTGYARTQLSEEAIKAIKILKPQSRFFIPVSSEPKGHVDAP